MKSKNTADTLTMQKKMKVIKKLHSIGCRTEKELLALTMLDVLHIESISIQDISIILAMQKHVNQHTLFSYLGEAESTNEAGSTTLAEGT